MKKGRLYVWIGAFALVFLIVALAYGLFGVERNSQDKEVIVGGDSDEHGCKASAGYIWSVIKQDCIRIWEENITVGRVINVGIDSIDLVFDDIAERFSIDSSLIGDIKVGDIVEIQHNGKDYNERGIIAIALFESGAKVCTADYSPVCGEDGVTYSNRCMAGEVFVMYEGECMDLSNCTNFFDGCNTCFVIGGEIGGCTRRSCDVYEKPKCLEFT